MSIPSPLKWHGGKGAFNGKLADWIISLMPPHIHYVEPFFGGGSVLLYRDPEDFSEVVNDIHQNLTNFWMVLQGEHTFNQFKRWMDVVPFSKVEFEIAKSMIENCKGANDPVGRAIHFFICCRQSMSGRMDSFAPLSKSRTRRGMNEQVSVWLTAIEGLPQVHERLKRVVIYCEDALDVIKREDSEHTCFYCDPPYLDETRSANDVYQHEYSQIQHIELLDTLYRIKGKFLLSGYRSGMYDRAAATYKWNRHDFPIVNNAATGETKRTMTECIWTNY